MKWVLDESRGIGSTDYWRLRIEGIVPIVLCCKFELLVCDKNNMNII